MKQTKRLMLYTAAAVAVGLAASGCGRIETAKQEVPVAAPEAGEPTPSASVFSLDDVANHATAEDCWMAIGGKVYDVTDYFGRHPGGDETLLLGCGLEATELFKTKPLGSGEDHLPATYDLLADYLIGELE